MVEGRATTGSEDYIRRADDGQAHLVGAEYWYSLSVLNESILRRRKCFLTPKRSHSIVAVVGFLSIGETRMSGGREMAV